MATTLFPLQYLRQNAQPIDVDSVFNTTAERLAYLSNGRRYPGQVVADLQENKVYVLDSAGSAWIEIGSGGSGGSGYSGVSGYSGTTGSSGYSGSAGPQGFSGYSGLPGAGTPAGSDTEVQFNDGGSFAGNSGFIFDKTTGTVAFDSLTNLNTSINVRIGEPVANSWISLYGDLGTNANDDYSSAVAYDSLGNIYSVGADSNTGTPFLLKYSPSGSLLAQVNFTEVNNYYKTGDAVRVDNTGNVYVVVGTDDSVSDFTLIKLDSSLTILWQVTFDDLSYEAGVDLTFDSAGNVILIGVINGTTITYVAKINSSGTIIWQRTLTGTNNCYPTGVAVDSLNNIYIGTQDTTPGLTIPYLVKYNSAGSLQWQRQFSDGVNSLYSGQVGVDSSGNVYTINGAYGYGHTVIKWNSSGSIVWQKFISTAGGAGGSSTGLALDTTGNLYCSIETNGIVYIHKFDSAGTELWQRRFTGSNGVDQYYYWAVQSLAQAGSYYTISGYTYTPNIPNAEAIVAQLPIDGGGMGSPGSFVYGPGNLVVTTGSVVDSAGTLIDAAGAITPVTGILAAAAASGTATFIEVTGVNDWYFNLDGSFSTPNYTLPGNSGGTDNALMVTGTGSVNWSNPLKLNGQCSLYINNLGSYGCMQGVATGLNNVAIGTQSLWLNAGGFGNVALGPNNLFNNTQGYNNIGIGTQTLFYNTTGCLNIAIGTTTLRDNCGNCNIALGYQAMAFGANTGGDNIAIGMNSLNANSAGNSNIALGNGSLAINTDGSNNIGIGCLAGGANQTGSNNVAIGSGALRFAIQSNNIGIGRDAGCLVEGGSNNTIIGNLYGSYGLNSTVLIGAGTCERIKVDCTGLYVNGSLIGAASLATPISAGTVFGCTSSTNCNTAMGYLATLAMSTGQYNTAVGRLAMYSNSTGWLNTAIGENTMLCNTWGSMNTAIGAYTLLSNTIGCANVAIGNCALYNNTTGCGNTAVGNYSLQNNNGGVVNVALGRNALCLNTTGSYNNALGAYALYQNTVGVCNIAVGTEALGCNTSGSNNIAIGNFAGCLITTGSNNTVIGNLTAAASCVCTVLIGAGACERIRVDNSGLYVNGSLIGGASPATPTSLGTVFGRTCGNNTSLGFCAGNTTMTGANNIAVGCLSLKSNISGANNVALGYGAMYGSACANCNIAIGAQSMCFNCRGNNNVALGPLTLANVISGCNNIAIGKESLCCNTCGTDNIAQGYRSLWRNTTGNGNVAIGLTTLSNNTIGCCNVALGVQALFCNTSGCHNIAQGYRALYCNGAGCGNIAFGKFALYTGVGSQNIAIGTCSQYSVNAGANNNISLGSNSLYCITSGCSNIAIGSSALFNTSTGTCNIAIGAQALLNNTTGYANIAIGFNALCCNVQSVGNIAIGIGALGSSNPSIGGDNIAIGGNTVTNGCYNIIIGYLAQTTTITSCNQIVLGTTQYTSQYAPSATWSALSDARDKNNIEDINIGLQFIRELRPVKFVWETRDGNRSGLPDSGFIAQDLLATINKWGVKDWLKLAIDDNPEKLYADPGKLIPVLVRAIQELAEELTAIKQQIS